MSSEAEAAADRMAVSRIDEARSSNMEVRESLDVVLFASGLARSMAITVASASSESLVVSGIGRTTGGDETTLISLALS